MWGLCAFLLCSFVVTPTTRQAAPHTELLLRLLAPRSYGGRNGLCSLDSQGKPSTWTRGRSTQDRNGRGQVEETEEGFRNYVLKSLRCYINGTGRGAVTKEYSDSGSVLANSK